MRFHSIYFISLLLTVLAGAQMQQISTLLESSAGRDQVTYNQWLATSIDISEDSLPIEVRSLTLRAAVLVPNANVYVAIHDSGLFRPSETETRYLFDSIGLGVADTAPVSSDYTMEPILDPEEPVPFLSPGERYWIVFGVSGVDFEQPLATGLYEWDYISGTPPLNSGLGLNIGSSIATSDTAGQDWSPSLNSPQSFSLEFVTVPEPQIWNLLIFLAIPSLTYRCRRLVD